VFEQPTTGEDSQVGVETKKSNTGIIHRIGHSSITSYKRLEFFKSTKHTIALIGIFLVNIGANDLISTGFANAQSNRQGTKIENPVQYDGQAMSCPDPDVFELRAPKPQKPESGEWAASCTSDFGEMNPIFGKAGYEQSANGLPIYESNNLEEWKLRSFIVTSSDYPSQAIPPLGNWPGGEYWSDEMHKIRDNYVVYFAAQINQNTVTWINKHYQDKLQNGDFGIFVGWKNKNNLFHGNWHFRLLHFRGQFNNVPGNSHEDAGGVIDPSVAKDSRTGQLDIVYAKQSNKIFAGHLSPNGLYMYDQVRLLTKARLPWECNPNSAGDNCVEEGPVINPDPNVKDAMDVYENTDSTWEGNYKIGFVVCLDIMKLRCRKYPHPVLESGNGLLGPGIGAQPFIGPNGGTYMAVHVQPTWLGGASHESQARYLAIEPIHYDTTKPFDIPDNINTSKAHSAGAILPEIGVPVPIVGNNGRTIK